MRKIQQNNSVKMPDDMPHTHKSHLLISVHLCKYLYGLTLSSLQVSEHICYKLNISHTHSLTKYMSDTMVWWCTKPLVTLTVIHRNTSQQHTNIQTELKNKQTHKRIIKDNNRSGMFNILLESETCICIAR